MGQGHMKTPALLVTMLTIGWASAEEPGRYVVAEATVLWHAPPATDQSLANRAAVLLQNDVCEVVKNDPLTPRWSCSVDGHALQGYAHLSAFRFGAPTAAPTTPLDALNKLNALANHETNPTRRDALRFEAELARMRLFPGCGDSRECQSTLLQSRLNLHRTATLMGAPAVASRQPLTCTSSLTQCLTAHFASDWVGTNELAFVTARKRGEGQVEFVVGDVLLGTDGQVRELLLQSTKTVDDPLFAAVNTANAEVRLEPSHPLESKAAVVVVESPPRENDSGSFVRGLELKVNRPLVEPLLVVCDAEVRVVKQPKLVRMMVAGEGLSQSISPGYLYALPCRASAVLTADVSGVRPGPYVRTRLGPSKEGNRTTLAGAVTIQEDGKRCSLTGAGLAGEVSHRQGEVLFVGDLNHDGRADVIVGSSGDMGCGATELLLSNETGWSSVALSSWEC